jgi:hypothetical protein
MRWIGCSSLVALVFSFTAAAQELDLVGQTGWSFWNARRLEIFADQIENNRDQGVSGTLRLAVFATESQPTGGDFTGLTPVGSLQLRGLPAGTHYDNIDYLVRYNPPTAGFYYTSIALEEFTEAGWEVADWEDFDGIVNFGGVGSGQTTADDVHDDIFFEGNVSWESAYGRVLISADYITNARAKRSGHLRMRLWALNSEYTGAVLDGYPLATKALGRLKSGFAFQDYSRTARFRVPPEGSYFITLVLEERVGNGWFVRDWVNFPGQSLF